MNEKSGTRTFKTKTKLAKAFIKLVNHTSYDNVNINSICSEAGISRATFYNNFTDIEDFLLYCFRYHLLKDIISVDNNNKNAHEVFHEFLTVLVTDLKQKEEFWEAIKGVNLYSSIYYCMRLWLIENLTFIFRKYREDLVDGIEFDYFCNALAFSIVGAFTFLLKKGDFGEDKFAEYLYKFTFVPYLKK